MNNKLNHNAEYSGINSDPYSIGINGGFSMGDYYNDGQIQKNRKAQ